MIKIEYNRVPAGWFDNNSMTSSQNYSIFSWLLGWKDITFSDLSLKYIFSLISFLSSFNNSVTQYKAWLISINSGDKNKKPGGWHLQIKAAGTLAISFIVGSVSFPNTDQNQIWFLGSRKTIIFS